MTTYQRNEQTVSGQLHDELVMMDIQQGRYFALNPTATRIWELLENPLDMEGLCRILCREFDVEPEQCHREVQLHLNEMTKLKLLHKTPS